MGKFKCLQKMLLILLLSVLLGIPMNTYASQSEPIVNANGALLMDADTGQVLYFKNGDKKFFPASTTKLMTAILVLENTKLTDKVTVGENPPFAIGSSIGLRTGEIYTVEDLLTGLLLMSGNDCAVALAEHVSGSVDEFAKLMNKKAMEIGAKNTHFVNPHGLPDETHVTTPYDLALILREAIKFPDYVRISKITSTKLPPSNLDGYELWLANHNYLINPNSKYYYEYALAGKSGYTVEAKHTFAIAGEKDGRRLVATFLNADDKNQNFIDMKNVLQYGFENFKSYKIYSKGDKIGEVKIDDEITVPLLASKDLTYSIPTNIDSINVDLKIPDLDISKKSFNEGDILGTAKVIYNGEEIATIDLLSGISRQYTNNDKIKSFLETNTYVVGIVILIILLTTILIVRAYNIRRRRKAFNKKWERVIKRR